MFVIHVHEVAPYLGERCRGGNARAVYFRATAGASAFDRFAKPYLRIGGFENNRVQKSETGRGYFRHPVSPLVPHSGSVLFSLERPCNWFRGQPPVSRTMRALVPTLFGVNFCGMFRTIASGFAKENCTMLNVIIN